MPTHIARFPGRTNDPAKHVLSKRQATRLAKLTSLPQPELVGKTVDELATRLRPFIDPRTLFFQRICGRVVKTDANGNDLPVPFATVTVYDTDINLLAWSPLTSKHSWFYPFGISREQLASVTTDECGQFCVWVPRFDLDHYLQWRLERHCYLEWLRKPIVVDVLREPPIPEPDPGPLRIDEPLLTRAARVLGTPVVARLREAATMVRPGALRADTDVVLAAPAFERLPPPLTKAASKMLEPGQRARLAARAGVPVALLRGLDTKHVYGPFLRCHTLLVPEWITILEIPDLTFEVTQDVDGDGTQEVIYHEGLFDVRWDATTVPDVTLRADPIAIASPGCNLPDPGPCGDPAILFASNYPLQATSAPSAFHDATSGYALLPNRPDEDGSPGGARIEPANAPFAGAFYLLGCAERPGATHYRVHHQVDGGPTTYLSGAYGPLTKVVSGTLLQLPVSPVDGQWYPIIPRSAGWTPVGILAPVSEGGNHQHTFSLEFGTQAGTTINPIAGSQTMPINMHIDGTRPSVEFEQLQWRQPDVSATWQDLSPLECPVMIRQGSSRVQIHLRIRVTANHLRDFSATASGCGSTAAPQLLTGTGGGPTSDPPAHWHMGPTDNAHVRDLYYELPVGAPAGCYRFAVYAASRAFQPTTVVTGSPPEVAWRIDTAPLWIHPLLAVALQ
jgi:hypothetical protein